MCRLALFNRAALQLLEKQSLDTLLITLEKQLGGDGNGVAALWQATGQIKLRKSVHFPARAAAGELRYALQQGADWGLFHTRFATSATVCSRACHPFHRGGLVLAHNGHDEMFAQLGALTRKRRSDSEALTEYWARSHLPISALASRSGVFVGFAHNQPFVVKGQSARDLVLAYHHTTGALLFASALPDTLASLFDEVIQVGKCTWQGEPLDLSTVDRRPSPPTQSPGQIVALVQSSSHVAAQEPTHLEQMALC